MFSVADSLADSKLALEGLFLGTAGWVVLA
jgi:hypothetical protein